MAPSKILRALGRVKDQTSIGLAMVSSSNTISALDVSIVKATRHEEKPPSEKHLKEIINLTCYSRAHVSACVNTLSRRLRKTRNWTVAVKTLMVIHRLLSRGDPAYEKEIFFFTSRWGERLLNMSDFRDSGANSWDFTTFARAYARYLDEQLEFRIERQLNRTRKSHLREGEEHEGGRGRFSSANAYSVCDMKTQQIFARSQQLQDLLERFLACQPTGKAKSNQVVFVALQSLVTESFEIYYYMTEIMSILIDRFMELEVPDCLKVLEIFCRAAKQFNEVDSFYRWCKTVGIVRSSDYPQVEKITPKKLMVMDEFIREKAAMARARKAKKQEAPEEFKFHVEEVHLLDMKALPAPEKMVEKQEEAKTSEESVKNCTTQLEVDLLDLSEDAESGEDDGDRLALTLYAGDSTMPPPTWEPFGANNELSDWEMALVQSAGSVSDQKTTLPCGGGFDMTLLDNLYQQGQMAAGGVSFPGGSASGMAFYGAASPAFLALPARPGSPAVPLPAYDQMCGVDQKQQELNQRLMWQQYVNNGMQGYFGWQQPPPQTLPHGW
ncbi:hypothetical protein AAC387_Pa07g0283 [Persea americana]